jgi:ABC-2 type transport system ATP-binding protein
MSALSIKNLTKTYSNGNQALKGINLTVETGDFYALLGPNGAGKTTAIGIISSLVNKSGGEVEIFGHSTCVSFDYGTAVTIPPVVCPAA